MMTKITWWKIPNQSLATSVREAGFDLAVYKDYREDIRDEIKSRGISWALWNLEQYFESVAGKALREIERGVYVICTSKPFTISYQNKYSSVIYIGEGNIFSRFTTHYKKSLFDFMQSLSGTNFDFHICEPKRRNSPNFYRHLEYLLLEQFKERIGGGNYPLLNARAGSNQNLPAPASGWNKPLKASGRKPTWALEFRQGNIRDYLLD